MPLLSDIITSNPKLRSLAQIARQLSLLQRHYLAIIARPLGQCSRVARYADGYLTLEADNGAVAQKLRQLIPQLIASFRTRGIEVTGIQIRVQASQCPPSTPTSPRSIGRQGRQALTELADSLPDNSPLKSSIQRMVKRAR